MQLAHIFNLRWIKTDMSGDVYPPLLPCSCQTTFCFSSCQTNHHFHFSSLHRQLWKPLSLHLIRMNLWLISLFWLNMGSVLYSFFVDVGDLHVCMCLCFWSLHMCGDLLPENVKCDFPGLCSFPFVCLVSCQRRWESSDWINDKFWLSLGWLVLLLPAILVHFLGWRQKIQN